MEGLGFNKLTALLCHWGYVSERLCRAMTETAERAAITTALPSLYRLPVGRFRHIGAIRAGSGKLQKMVKRIPSFLHSTDAETVPFHEKRSYSKYNF